MLTRRDFLKASTAAGIIGLTKPIEVLASLYQDSSGFFGVHPFIEANPDAVFIMRTDVDVKTNTEALCQTGLDFGRSVLVPMSEKDGGVPLTHKVAIKPNITCSYTDNGSYDIEYRMGIITDPYFVEGVIEGMKELGLSSGQIYMREANCPDDFEAMGYTAMAERTDTDLLGGVSYTQTNDVTWVYTPEGMVFRKIPYIWPINSPDSWLLNIAKLKAHGMGLTLTAKNHQGSVALDYCKFCKGMSGLLSLTEKNPNAKAEITANYEMNKAAGIPRWDKPGTSGDQNGIGMEVWAQRTLDNHSVTNTGLFVIEGVYGRDGNGFLLGPNPESETGDDGEGEAWDYMTNIIVFGKNSFHVDNIGHWLGGHEPGNMGYLHLAMQRGMNSFLNPENIPVYEWKNGEAIRTPLKEFERTPLKTYYLQRNYDGQTEPRYHLVNEPFDYPAPTKVDSPDKPEALVLGQNHPNPFNPFTSIEYNLPSGGSVRLEIYNTAGQLVDVLANGYRSAGTHMAVWNTGNHPSGVYFYRLRYGGFSEIKKMTLLK